MITIDKREAVWVPAALFRARHGVPLQAVFGNAFKLVNFVKG